MTESHYACAACTATFESSGSARVHSYNRGHRVDFIADGQTRSIEPDWSAVDVDARPYAAARGVTDGDGDPGIETLDEARTTRR